MNIRSMNEMKTIRGDQSHVVSKMKQKSATKPLHVARMPAVSRVLIAGLLFP